MGKVMVLTNLTLDGVMQAPGRPDEDRRGGFAHGGWAAPYAAMANVFSAEQDGDGAGTPRALLLGRRTYEDFYAVWPNRTDNPFTAVLNAARKYVASTTLKEPLPWQNSTLLAGDAAEGVARLKEEPGRELL
ncbi:MAG TPA: dihydrofolate reductase, partial [Ktedonobacterales bacterium]